MSDPSGVEPASERAATVDIVSGHPTPEETAAVVAVLMALTRGSAEPRQGAVATAWCAPVRRMRAPVRSGRHAWWRSALPR